MNGYGSFLELEKLEPMKARALALDCHMRRGATVDWDTGEITYPEANR